MKREDVERVARKYLDPGRMAVLVVGDVKVIEPGLRSLEGIGATVTMLDAEGRQQQQQALANRRLYQEYNLVIPVV